MIASPITPDEQVAVVTAIYLEALDDARRNPLSRWCQAKLEATEQRLREVSAIAQQRTAA